MRTSGPNGAHSGRSDFFISSDEWHAEGNSRRGDNAIRHVGNVGTGDLVDTVGNARIYRDDLEAAILSFARLTNAHRRAGADLSFSSR